MKLSNKKDSPLNRLFQMCVGLELALLYTFILPKGSLNAPKAKIRQPIGIQFRGHHDHLLLRILYIYNGPQISSGGEYQRLSEVINSIILLL